MPFSLRALLKRTANGVGKIGFRELAGVSEHTIGFQAKKARSAPGTSKRLGERRENSGIKRLVAWRGHKTGGGLGPIGGKKEGGRAMLIG